MTLVAWMNHPWALLWTEALLHFLWQGTLLASIAGLVMNFRHPQSRYAAFLALFVLMTACPVATMAFLIAAAPASSGSSPTDAEIDNGSVMLATANQDVSEYPDELPRESAVTGFVELAVQESMLQSGGSWPIRFPRWQPWLLTGWSLGVFGCCLRLLLGLQGLRLLARTAQSTPASWQMLMRRLSSQLRLGSAVVLCVSHRVAEPLAIWWWRPMIVLPAAWLTEVPPGVLESVLAHELAHLRRWDLWINFYQRLGETALFYHPGVWWLSRRIRIERELCCDAAAVSLVGQPLGYARALEYVARKRLEQVRPLLAAGMGGTEMTLLNRVQRVLGLETPRRSSGGWSLGVVSVAILAAGGLMLAVSSRAVVGDEPAARDVTDKFIAEGDRENPPPPPRRPEGPPDGDRPRGPEGDRPRDGGPPPEGRRGEGPPPRRGDFGPREGGERGPERGPGPEGDRGPRRGPGPEGERGGPPPGGDLIHELMHEIRVLRDEVARLREEVRGMRGGDRGPEGPERGLRGPGRGREAGGPPPEGERRFPPPEGRRGDGPEGRGPREGFGPPRPPRDGEGPPPPPREGDRGPEGRRGPPPGERREGGEGDRPRRPPLEDAPKRDA